MTPDKFELRARDWRNGPVVYQVFVDRFQRAGAPSGGLVPWSTLPVAGHLIPEKGVWSHELDFYGGNLKGIESKLDYVEGLDADVLYLTPIFRAQTNHRYDTQDYRQIDPMVGTQADLKSLIEQVHQRRMRLMLDGVFNHMGKTSPRFVLAEQGKGRDWFTFDAKYPLGYKAWAGVPNLPAVNLENPAVRKELWGVDDSVVAHYLREGIDGWRLDVAYDIGPRFLTELTESAHRAKPGSAVVGEISGYPADWFPAVDGVFNFFSLRVARGLLEGRLDAPQATAQLQDSVNDAGIDNLLKSWLLLDNHDTDRIASAVPDWRERRLLEALQFTLPGAPLIYYGSEVGMTGSGDPGNRAPMRWDLVSKNPEELQWIRRLSGLRRDVPSLRWGDIRFLRGAKCLAFARSTHKLGESAIVVVNPSAEKVHESLATRTGMQMSWGDLRDRLGGGSFRAVNGILELDVPAKSVMVLAPVVKPAGYSPFERIP